MAILRPTLPKMPNEEDNADLDGEVQRIWNMPDAWSTRYVLTLTLFCFIKDLH